MPGAVHLSKPMTLSAQCEHVLESLVLPAGPRALAFNPAENAVLVQVRWLGAGRSKLPT